MALKKINYNSGKIELFKIHVPYYCTCFLWATRSGQVILNVVVLILFAVLYCYLITGEGQFSQDFDYWNTFFQVVVVWHC